MLSKLLAPGPRAPRTGTVNRPVPPRVATVLPFPRRPLTYDLPTPRDQADGVSESPAGTRPQTAQLSVVRDVPASGRATPPGRSTASNETTATEWASQWWTRRRREQLTSSTAAAAALATVCALCVVAAPSAQAATTPSFATLAAGLTQELYGTFPATAPVLAGGLAFAANGDLVAGECRGAGDLHRFFTPTIVKNTSVIRQERVVTSTVGCGLVNGPAGAVYSNTAQGVVRVNPDTGAIVAGPAGPAGNALGIAYDPLGSRFIYAAEKGLVWVKADLTTGGVLTTTDAYDGVYLDPSGRYLFAADGEGTAILDRSGVLIQRVLSSAGPGGVTDGVAFHATDGYVVTNNHDGSLTRLDFPGGDYTKAPVQTLLASGGFRGDLTAVGADGCLYVTQDGARYGNGTVVATEQSVVKICGGFAPPPSVPAPTPTPTPKPTATPTPTPTPVPSGPRAVAIGDGYASGEGSGGYLPSSASASPRNDCHRSTAAYPWALAAAQSRPAPAVVACSHSGIADLFAANAGDNAGPGGAVEPAQLNAVGPQTTLVTVSLGATDLGLDGLVSHCLTTTLDAGAAADARIHPIGRPRRWTASPVVTRLSQHGYPGTHPGSRPSDDAGTRDGSALHTRSGERDHGRSHDTGQSHDNGQSHHNGHDRPTTITTGGCSAGTAQVLGTSLETTVAARLAVLAGSSDLGLDHALRELRRRAPSATIVVTGYPALFGSDCGLAGGCVAGRLTVTGSPGTQVDAMMTDPDAAWLDAVIGRLDQALRDAVARAGHGVVYADVAPRFTDHGLCSGPGTGSGSWIVPVSGTINATGDGVRLDPWSLHPTALGQSQGYLPAVRSVTP